ncbi:MAG TPA: CoA pyrophosphatase [Candidatus Latescibacteria bacterium]|nr:CoA pyrophosphatase [Candidatus Handelsmanbacteria bacterium]HIL10267.1 CoA pyrophosphatase [Candidatus Latescibacterota bacterium]
MNPLNDIHRALATRTPVTAKTPGSAVAAILQEGASPQLLFIERARVKGDPWSGDIAFPGGRVETSDADLREAAERETREEIGLELRADHYLGRLDDLTTQTFGIEVAAFVYRVEKANQLQLNDEVTTAFWQPFSNLTDPARQLSRTFANRGFSRHLPAIDLLGPNRPLLWGITYRFVAQLMQLAGQPLPETIEQA